MVDKFLKLTTTDGKRVFIRSSMISGVQDVSEKDYHRVKVYMVGELDPWLVTDPVEIIMENVL